MPVEIEVGYSPALTEAERLLLTSIEGPITESVCSVFSIPRVRWTPWQNEHGHTLYILAPSNERSDIIVHYSEAEIRQLTRDSAENDVAFGRRNQVQSGFSERPEPL